MTNQRRKINFHAIINDQAAEVLTPREKYSKEMTENRKTKLNRLARPVTGASLHFKVFCVSLQGGMEGEREGEEAREGGREREEDRHTDKRQRKRQKDVQTDMETERE